MNRQSLRMQLLALGRFLHWICPLVLFLSLFCLFCRTGLARTPQDSIRGPNRPAPSESPKIATPYIVFGFVGGWVRHDDLVHSEVQLAASLQKAYGAGVDVETFENSNGKKALRRILAILDTNHDGKLTTAEKQDAHIIIYGHSWGASEAITLARQLGSDGIPVLLTIQVDSVTKMHQNDTVIPANVSQAVNFYQANGFVHGQSEIRAADPARTKIIGNFKSNYRTSRYACTEYPWYDHLFANAHTQIECDPNVWKQVESLIREYLPPKPSTEQTH